MGPHGSRNTRGGKDASQIIAGPGKVSPPKREKYDTYIEAWGDD